MFQTPVKWLAAILGKPVPDVKKNRAYREVRKIIWKIDPGLSIFFKSTSTLLFTGGTFY